MLFHSLLPFSCERLPALRACLPPSKHAVERLGLPSSTGRRHRRASPLTSSASAAPLGKTYKYHLLKDSFSFIIFNYTSRGGNVFTLDRSSLCAAFPCKTPTKNEPGWAGRGGIEIFYIHMEKPSRTLKTYPPRSTTTTTFVDVCKSNILRHHNQASRAPSNTGWLRRELQAGRILEDKSNFLKRSSIWCTQPLQRRGNVERPRIQAGKECRGKADVGS